MVAAAYAAETESGFALADITGQAPYLMLRVAGARMEKRHKNFYRGKANQFTHR